MSLPLLSVASEAFPLIKTGGLADVVGALPQALAEQGVAVRTLIPGYPAVLAEAARVGAAESPLTPGLEAQAGPGRLLAFTSHGRDFVALDLPKYFNRDGAPYLTPEGRDWPDNPLRFAALGRAAAEIGLHGIEGWKPAVVHAHDWQAGLAPAYLHYAGGPRPGTVITIHNIAFAGKCPLALREAMHLPPEATLPDGVEFYGTLSPLKGGIAFADRITTVSPTYAAEICTPEGGMGFDGILRARGAAVSGILNGIDTEAWDPRNDSFIAAKFDPLNLIKRSANKAELQSRFNLPKSPDTLLYGVVSRLSWQKGLDLLLQVLPELMESGAQLVLLGNGDRPLEDGFRDAMQAHPSQISCVIGYNEPFAHMVQAGVDALLVPSRFEPCGLTQLYALRYGAVPVVGRVGGLADTIIDANPMALAAGAATGVQFSPITAEGLAAALRRTAILYSNRVAWKQMQVNGLATDVSWREPARHYAALYRSLAQA